eukprot:g9322.t1
MAEDGEEAPPVERQGSDLISSSEEPATRAKGEGAKGGPASGDADAVPQDEGQDDAEAVDVVMAVEEPVPAAANVVMAVEDEEAPAASVVMAGEGAAPNVVMAAEEDEAPASSDMAANAQSGVESAEGELMEKGPPSGMPSKEVLRQRLLDAKARLKTKQDKDLDGTKQEKGIKKRGAEERALRMDTQDGDGDGEQDVAGNGHHPSSTKIMPVPTQRRRKQPLVLKTRSEVEFERGGASGGHKQKSRKNKTHDVDGEDGGGQMDRTTPGSARASTSAGHQVIGDPYQGISVIRDGKLQTGAADGSYSNLLAANGLPTATYLQVTLPNGQNVLMDSRNLVPPGELNSLMVEPPTFVNAQANKKRRLGNKRIVDENSSSDESAGGGGGNKKKKVLKNKTNGAREPQQQVVILKKRPNSVQEEDDEDRFQEQREMHSKGKVRRYYNTAAQEAAKANPHQADHQRRTNEGRLRRGDSRRRPASREHAVKSSGASAKEREVLPSDEGPDPEPRAEGARNGSRRGEKSPAGPRRTTTRDEPKAETRQHGPGNKRNNISSEEELGEGETRGTCLGEQEVLIEADLAAVHAVVVAETITMEIS